jgi:hypothetical protein
VIERQGGEYGIALHQVGEFHRGLSQRRHLVEPETARKVEREDYCERARERDLVVHCEEIYLSLLAVFENLYLFGAQVADVASRLVSGGYVNHDQVGIHADAQSGST